MQAGHLQPAERIKYLFAWRRLLSADSRQRDAAALRMLAARGRHEAAAALVRAALAQELPAEAAQQQPQQERQAGEEQRRQVQEQAAALAPLLERCVAAGALKPDAAAVYAAAFCRLLPPDERQLDLQAFQTLATEAAWATLDAGVAAALAELPA